MDEGIFYCNAAGPKPGAGGTEADMKSNMRINAIFWKEGPLLPRQRAANNRRPPGKTGRGQIQRGNHD
jgi:hypothetical protein